MNSRKIKKILDNKLKNYTKRIPVTTEFRKFYESVNNIFKDDEQVQVIYRDEKNLNTYCDKRKIYLRLKTESILVYCDKYHVIMSPINDGVYVHLLKVNPLYRQLGLGNSVMKMIRQVSNELNIPVYLIPLPLQGENVEYETLQRFYSNHGYSHESDSRYWKYEPNSIIEMSDSYRMVS